MKTIKLKRCRTVKRCMCCGEDSNKLYQYDNVTNGIDGFGVCYGCLVNFVACMKCRTVVEVGDIYTDKNAKQHHIAPCHGEIVFVSNRINGDTYEAC